MDIDEILIPVNFSPKDSSWCSPDNPVTLQRITDQMLVTATSTVLSTYKLMNETKHSRRSVDQHCPLGWSLLRQKCQPISAFSMPVRIWQNDGTDYTTCEVMPNLRSKHPTGYLAGIKSPEETNTIAQTWKSIYQTKYNPPLSGRSMHHNPTGGFSFLAPRHYLKSLSLEIGHNRLPHSHESTNFSALVSDRRLQRLADSYIKCMREVKV